MEPERTSHEVRTSDGRAPIRQNPALILIVDDDATSRRMIEHIMAHVGFRTATAGTVADAQRIIAARKPDLILMDVGLPDGSGFDVCRRVRADVETSQTPVLFISANDDAATKVEGFRAGGVDYVSKPIHHAELVARVRTHLRLRNAYEALAELQAERLQRLGAAQKALMPKPRELPDARFQVALEPIDSAGGDFYDVIPVGTHSFDYLVADVSGHDLASTYWTSALKALVAEYAKPEHSPMEVVQAMNRIFGRVLPPGLHFTAIYARLDRRGRRLSLVTAGHPPAILIPAAGGPGTLLESESDVVGGFTDAVFDARELPVQAGDRIFLYSDGLVEAGGSSRQGGEVRLLHACERSRGAPLAQAVDALKRDMTLAAKVTDDVVLLGIDV